DLKDTGINSAEAVVIKKSDGRTLNGFFIAAPDARRVVLAIPNRFGNLSVPVLTGHVPIMARAGCSLLLFDYTGKGKNAGNPTLEGAVDDVEAALTFLLKEKKFSEKQIIIYAPCQLSAYFAQKLLARHSPASVILEGQIAKTQTEICALLPWMTF